MLSAAAALVACAAVLATLASPASALRGDFYGVVTQEALDERDFELMQDADVGTLRLQFGWPLIQREKGRCQASSQIPTPPADSCDWRAYDAAIGSAAERGVRIFPYLLNVPPWIAKDPEKPPIKTKKQKRYWKRFVRAAVKRYGPGGAYWETQYKLDHPRADPLPIKRWQVWNEPSADPFWHPKPNARDYGKLVKTTSRAIRSKHPGAYIVLAGLFGTPNAEDGGIRQDRFLRQLYRVKRIKRYFDAVALHPYAPDIARVKFQVAKWARKEMRRARDAGAGIWISEIGWSSDRVHQQLGVGPKGQAKMLRKSFELFAQKRNRWNIAGVNWYAWQDSDNPGLCDFCRRSGIIDVTQDPKRAYSAYAKAVGGR